MESIWGRVTGRTQALLKDGLRAITPPLDARFEEELEELLIAADMGPTLAARLARGVLGRSPRTREEAAVALRAELTGVLSLRQRRLRLESRPACVLLYGVNGAGKTTTAAKLAHLLAGEGANPLLVAADTFRAAGIEQLQVWAERAGVPCFAGRPGGDPAAAVFDGLNLARARGHDVVVVDTAGRLHTQQNLLGELAKIGRVAAKAMPGAPHESLLVLDGNLGLSALAQAQSFNAALSISGLVVTKLEGSARGGALVAIETELGLPTKLIGLGEGLSDLARFDTDAFAAGLFSP
ncbi:MAG TPA: signal recognition particle-docking protein FtsY [Candidatus Nitrosotalea sp.]|nr:signal recognition particle-docking protein FtsY [Candidatus Nitrosotalea sp.]